MTESTNHAPGPALDTAVDSTDGRVQKGNETRRLVLARAVSIASVEGLGGLSLGRLASELSLSKSGVFALFGSKEELQLATVRAAQRIYRDTVIEPVRRLPSGVGQVWELALRWLEYSRGRVFAGGCFFYAVGAEFDAQPGRVRDVLAEGSLRWHRIVLDLLESARAAGELHADADLEQLAFEMISFLEYANAMSLLHEDEAPYARARRAVLLLLRSESVDGSLLPAA
ncbi:TetR family transcriptional regulator [Kitasatospora sp. NBC_01250]|uniref:TetR family transcriptional regulator C-terminal domain-containing protein n=1 Tax=unclassified Kitasatospora TaxID=2633591 RepID=UPI002E107AAF|nr:MULTISPECIES: TetR/AcrR family transcriptional regulator [unclassified Kitasatospora]WSJ68514.1 TetR family transcriptional regulator [Kitasatospora sp. NBC_01302]